MSNSQMIQQANLFSIETGKSAVLSECRAYRYALWRKLREGGNYVNFIGLNPSTADEFRDDHTIRRCVGFARRWGFDAICMTNLFAFRATDPMVMKTVIEPVGIDNDKWLLEIAESASLVVAAWGTHGRYLDRDARVKELLRHRLFCLGKTNNGFPLHPARLPNDLKPVPFT